MVLGAQVGRRGRIENEIGGVVSIDHRIHVEQVCVRRVKPHQRLQRRRVEFRAVIGGIEQSAMEISIDDARCELTDLSHVRTKHIPPRLLRQPLWDGHDGHENEPLPRWR